MSFSTMCLRIASGIKIYEYFTEILPVVAALSSSVFHNVYLFSHCMNNGFIVMNAFLMKIPLRPYEKEISLNGLNGLNIF